MVKETNLPSFQGSDVEEGDDDGGDVDVAGMRERIASKLKKDKKEEGPHSLPEREESEKKTSRRYVPLVINIIIAFILLPSSVLNSASCLEFKASVLWCCHEIFLVSNPVEFSFAFTCIVFYTAASCG